MSDPRILVAVDFSPSSDEVVDFAVTVAQGLGARVDLIHAAYMAPLTQARLHAPDAIDKIVAAEERAAIEKLMAMMEAHVPPGHRGEVRLEKGAAAETVVKATAAGDYLMVVVGKARRNALSQLLMGSVAERVTRLSTIPVLVVR